MKEDSDCTVVEWLETAKTVVNIRYVHLLLNVTVSVGRLHCAVELGLGGEGNEVRIEVYRIFEYSIPW